MKIPPRSHSPNKIPLPGHRCTVILTEEQWDSFIQTGVLKKRWFGNGQSILVKDSLAQAMESFNKADEKVKGTQPFQTLLFHIPLTTYHDWVHEGVMVRTSHVGGYRIKADINVKEIDPDFTLHPLS